MSRTTILMPRTIAGARTTAGQRQIVRNFGTCLNFSGVTDVSSSLWSSATSNISITAWAKNSTNAFTRQPIFINGAGIQTPGIINGYALVLSGNGTIDGSLYILNENVAWINCNYKVKDRNWHHYALVANSSGFPSVYVDGVAIYNPGSGSLVTPTGTSSSIGNDNAQVFTGYWRGKIDDVRVYASALTSVEILNLYYGIEPLSVPINWYKFNEGTGSVATDSGSAPKNATITSATYSTDVFMVPRTVAV